jgi:Adenylate and Guanylate cyclase catalytic domain
MKFLKSRRILKDQLPIVFLCLLLSFGDTVNTASRMESHGQPSKIHVSWTTEELLRLFRGTYTLQSRGLIAIKVSKDDNFDAISSEIMHLAAYSFREKEKWKHFGSTYDPTNDW